MSDNGYKFLKGCFVMKKANKIISIILAAVMALSCLPVLASASAVNDSVKTVDALIQPNNLGNLVEWLLKNLNTRKEELVPSVLRIAFLFIEDESLVIDYLRGDVDGDSSVSSADARLALRNSVGLEKFTEDMTKAADIDGAGISSSDARLILRASVGLEDLMAGVLAKSQIMTSEAEKLATVLVNWLNANLPTWTADVYKEDIVKTILNIVDIDLKSVDGIVNSLYTLATMSGLGDISNLKEDALIYKKGGFMQKDTVATVANSGSLNIVYRLLQFLSDNTSLFKSVINGNVKLGLLAVLNGTINDLIKDYISYDAIKEMLIDALELNPDTYRSYTADELVAVAFLKLLTGNENISKTEASNVMNLTIYGLLETYAGDIYANLLLDLINNDAKDALKDLANKDTTGTIAEVINLNYEFKADTFDAYLGAGKGNMVAQLNNLVITLLEIILNEDAFSALALEEGDNSKLNGNLTKTFRYVLPLIKDIPDLGVDLSGFTADKVKNMDAEEMAVAVLKLFFEGWFKNEDMAEVNKAKTLEQLAVLAAKYAVTYDEWVPMTITAAAKATKVESFSDAACLDLIFEIGMETAAKALAYNSDTTYYELPKDTSKWTGEDYLDDIVDWALNFADGLPVAADKLSTERHKIDGNGGFYKLNVVLNSLIDLSFISGCGNKDFALDIETMLMDKFLGNLLNFDIEASVAILAENEDSSLFNKKVNEAAIDLVDDLLTGLLEK